MDLSQSIKEITDGSIKEEESHCLKKLTRVLSQRIGEEKNNKKFKRNVAGNGMKSGQVFDLMLEGDKIVTEEGELESLEDDTTFTRSIMKEG